MALIEVKVPQLSESVAEATLLQWKKKPGQAVEIDEILVEIETDKVVLEVPAPAAGVLAQIIKNDGDSCISRRGDRQDRHRGPGSGVGRDADQEHPAGRARAGREARRPPEVAARAETKSELAMPAAAKLMAERDLRRGSVPGTGRDGRVTKGDVLEALASGNTKPRARRRRRQPAAAAAAPRRLRAPRRR